MRYRILNWSEYQHYKDRCPPWIKLHHSLLTSEVWVMGNDASRALTVACMLLAARNNDMDGSFNGDPEYIKRFAYLTSTPDFNPLIKYGFLEMLQDASDVIAKCNTETEQSREEKEKIKQTRGTRLQVQSLTSEWGNIALETRSDWSNDEVIAEFEVFKDYWIAQPGQKGVKTDWLATWRNWCRKSYRKGEAA